MYPRKTYTPAILKSTNDETANELIGKVGVLALYVHGTDDPPILFDHFEFYTEAEEDEPAVWCSGIVSPEMADSGLCISFSGEKGEYSFDVSRARGIDYKCVSPQCNHPNLGEWESLYMSTLVSILDANMGDEQLDGSPWSDDWSDERASDLYDGFFEDWDTAGARPRAVFKAPKHGLRCDFRHRRKDLCGARGFKKWAGFSSYAYDTARIFNLNITPGHFSIYPEGSEVAFKHDGGIRRGTVWGYKFSDARYLVGNVVDIIVAEEDKLYEGVPTEDVLGEFRAGINGPLCLGLDSKGDSHLPILDSIHSENKLFFNSYHGMESDSSLPASKYTAGDVVVFREHSNAPYQVGVIVRVWRSTGMRLPRGAYYTLDCPVRETIIIDLPENNIFHLLSGDTNYETHAFDQLIKREETRASIVWNGYEGGGFSFKPIRYSDVTLCSSGAPQQMVSMEELPFSFSISEDTFAQVYNAFEKYYDPSHLVNRTESANNGFTDGFEWYGDNYFNLDSCRKIIKDLELLADHGSCSDKSLVTIRRFIRVFEYLIHCAQSYIEESDGFKRESGWTRNPTQKYEPFGIIVRGP